MFFKIFLEPMTACVKVIKPNNRNSASSGSSRGRKCTNAPNASKYPQIRLNSIPTFHLYFTISNILYICVMYVDMRFFHPLYASFHSLKELLPWNWVVDITLVKGVEWGGKVKEMGR
jgi:hypothetical protein